MRRGFTLVELMAVIIIISILLTIFIPIVTDTISNSTKRAFSVDAKNIIRQIEYKLAEKNIDLNLVDETNIQSNFNIEPINYETITLTKINGEPYILIKGKNKWDGLMVYGTYSSINVEKDTNYNLILKQVGYNNIKEANEPKLSDGMTPIKWNGTSWVDTTEEDENWYDYTNKKWANARTEDGSMWVWIPRYIYKISSGWHSNTTGSIEVQFSMGTDDTINNTVTLDIGTTSDASNNKWTNHPGFTFGSTELTGIWVAKFEPTAKEGIANEYTGDWTCFEDGDNVTTKTVQILPNSLTWRCITASNAFTAIRNMESNSVYGWNTSSTLNADGTYATDNNIIDTHLMKNVEWGAVAYLSKSIYGKENTEVWINNNLYFISGCSGDSSSSGSYSGCQYTYESTNGVQASTTGNIYGVYDMNGSSWERVAAYVNNTSTNLATYGSSVINASSKYKDVYTVDTTDAQANNYALSIEKKGDAMYETSNNIDGAYSWFGDYSYMPAIDDVWILRGGDMYRGSASGIYCFDRNNGYPRSFFGFRPALLVNKNL